MILLYIFMVILFFYFLYFILICFGLFKKTIIFKEKKFNHKFAILIAARNEGTVIGNLIDSLQKQNYDKDDFSIYVIVNNCSDDTESISLKHGANVIKCTENVHSKGEVLKFAFNELKKHDDISAYAIFDADNVVDVNFLSSMNAVLNNGYNVAQGFRNTKNVSDNWLSGSYAILYYIQSVFINKARFKMGKSSFINGTGFVVKKEVIDKYGFNPKTITEDIEFTMMCALNDEKIAYAEKAITYDEQVTNLKTSLKQRKRWSFGTLRCFKYYYKDLIRHGFKNKKFECFDVIMFYSTVFMQIFAFVVSVALLFLGKYLFLTSIYFDIISIFVFFIFSLIFRIVLVKKCNNKFSDNIWGILTFDIFLLTWLPINCICLFKKNCGWDPIVHNRNINI